MATGNMHINLLKFDHVVFELCERTDGHTDKQTDTLITIFHFPEAKVKTLIGRIHSIC